MKKFKKKVKEEERKFKLFHNMPKYQPCDKCRHWSSRIGKTLGGAIYRCTTHGRFLVRRYSR